MLADILGKLIPRAQSRELRPGQFLFRQGDRAEYIFALEHGQIVLTRYLSSGKSVPMHAARAGQTFTEAALFSDVYHCNAVAGAKSRVRMYAKHELLSALGRDPSLALQYVASLSREVNGCGRTSNCTASVPRVSASCASCSCKQDPIRNTRSRARSKTWRRASGSPTRPSTGSWRASRAAG